MEVAGVELSKDNNLNKAAIPDASAEGIQRAVDVAALATRGNYVGPLVAAVTFVRFCTLLTYILYCAPTSRSSRAPPPLPQSCPLASVIPAPMRTLYASTKAASLLLYLALAIEHPRIAFTLFMPLTVDGYVRSEPVDGGAPCEADPNMHGLKRGT
ncbi:hypothetical protein C8J57DRAFT_1613027 [Mycena rebaudengoi]|nr:hypothetical protein C8J57DRAFT_1598347 [Mycena rebaudengoi]KAJ7268636.1 hypothetical protein C8J57DRAFT_1613027 [Mycena rebaudengoi]